MPDTATALARLGWAVTDTTTADKLDSVASCAWCSEEFTRRTPVVLLDTGGAYDDDPVPVHPEHVAPMANRNVLQIGAAALVPAVNRFERAAAEVAAAAGDLPVASSTVYERRDDAALTVAVDAASLLDLVLYELGMPHRASGKY